MILDGSERVRPCRTNDDIENKCFICGVVEGFYGRPWTSEQRKKMFKRMNKLGLNTYLYAPKDDSKHRLNWRDLYSVEEADNLTSLIDAATESNVTFVYAISPGLDITYSSSKEITCLKRKLEQVASFGCKSFALLFDDIEIDMCEADKQIFQSFAHAQVSITNEVYQHLGQPSFMFCPTEYCASRAVPSVPQSEYLSTLGSKLLSAIDVMWTGPKVVSRRITIKSIEELTDVLKRPPLIWDNIHANDYDAKRVFLGPYLGRSPELIPYIRGVLTNPNCEFESNYIAMSTLAQWGKSNVDGVKKDSTSESPSPVSSDIRLERDGDNSSDEDIPFSNARYLPKKALRQAIDLWMEEIYTECKPPSIKGPWLPPSLVTNLNLCPPVDVLLPKDEKILNETDVSSYMQPVMALNPVNSLLDSPVSSDNESLEGSRTVEPMDCAVTPSSSPVFTAITPQIAAAAEVMQIDTALPSVDNNLQSRLTPDEVAIMVDMFYLPFEHGSSAIQMLLDFHWLKCHAHFCSEARCKKPSADSVANAALWAEKEAAWQATVQEAIQIVSKLKDIPNRALFHELFPYVWDALVVLRQVSVFIKWLALGLLSTEKLCCMPGNPYTWANSVYREAFTSGEQEPWMFRGGLPAEFHRMMPLEAAGDLILLPAPAEPVLDMYTVRPYLASDEARVFEICRRTCDDGMDGTDIFPDHPDVIADRLVGPFLTLCPEYCFVVEDQGVICGYILTSPDCTEFHKRMTVAYLPAMQMKYPKPDKNDKLTPAEEVISSFYEERKTPPVFIQSSHPTLVRMDFVSEHRNVVAAKTGLSVACLALKAFGSCGLHAEVSLGDRNTVEFYSKLSFFDLSAQVPSPEEFTIMGRVI